MRTGNASKEFLKGFLRNFTCEDFRDWLWLENESEGIEELILWSDMIQQRCRIKFKS